MRAVFAVFMALHGLIHLMGFAKAFGYAELPQLTQPLSRGAGLGWLAAALLVLAAATLFLVWPRGWWVVGAAAVLVSQVMIVQAWGDAKPGTLANAILLLAVLHGWLTQGSGSFQARFERDAAAGLARPVHTPLVTEADLAPLPPPVQRYLRAVGVVGQPRVVSYRLRFTGRIRSGPGARWMPFEADQQSFADRPTRLFLMRARMFGLPVQAFHRMAGGRATMQVKVAGAVTMVDAAGEVLDRSESVTLFNDMCLLAPATLLDPAVTWADADARTARARFANGAHVISATLVFGDDGLLTDFVSDDRSRLSPDGRTFTRQRFSTPVREYRQYGAVRLARFGETRYHPAEGEFVYGEFELLGVEYNR